MSLNTDYAFIPSLMFYPWHVAKFGVKIDGANPPEGSASFTDKYKYVHTHTTNTHTHTERYPHTYVIVGVCIFSFRMPCGPFREVMRLSNIQWRTHTHIHVCLYRYADKALKLESK